MLATRTAIDYHQASLQLRTCMSMSKKEPPFEFSLSRQFSAWMVEQKVSIAITTYQAGILFLLGIDQKGQFSLFNRTFNRVMGLHFNSDQLFLSDLCQLWRFENTLEPGQQYQGYDRCYLPQMCWTTGDLDIHDIGLDNSGRPLFVNTLFGCIARVSDTHSFAPVWRPPFISKLAAEDRCHLNGMAMIEGEPRYVTSVSQSDIADGWRDHRKSGGVVIDVKSNDIIVEGLSMPHSPRWYQGKLWLLDSGNGNFGYVDSDTGKFEPVCLCPGYARGLSFIGDFAVVGLSRPRHNKTFSGLALDDRLKEKNSEPRCGVIVIDLRTGDVVHNLRISGVIEELYDVSAVANIRCPMAIGFKNDEIRRMISIDS